MHRVTTIRRRVSRRGLAPLELTLALPLLLMLMALMILIGTAGAWKVRTSANSRQAILRAIHPRTTDSDPDPPNWWPQSASLAYHDGGNSFLTDDPYENHPAVRGPSIADPQSGNSLRVLVDTLDMTAGMRSGQAAINHEPAMWSRLNFRNRFTGENVMFAGQTWTYGNMGIGSNDSRRLPHQYDFEMSKYNPGAAARVLAAQSAIQTNPYRPALMVLDQDAELRAWNNGNNIDFYPLPRSACTRDPLRLQEDVVRPLLDDIDRRPQRMRDTFLQMYQDYLQRLENMQPPPPDYAQRKADLEEKIRQLQAFMP